MLLELTVRDLGVIDELRLTFEPGMTVVTGETGAGKTLVVEALELLVGGRADAVLVRPGAEEAWVEGRFLGPGGDEVILGRAVPADGRSRGYLDGRMASAAALAEAGADLVDLHGQHSHQSLLTAAVQRRSLDAFGGVDRAPLDEARARLREAQAGLQQVGGDERARAREIDLLRFQIDELTSAALSDADEEAQLEKEEAVLGQAAAWRDAASTAHELLAGEGGAGEALASAVSTARGRGSESPYAPIVDRLAAALAEINEAAADLRMAGEAIADDPERLGGLQERRHLLRELRRKYGDTLADVIAFAEAAKTRLDELLAYEQRAATLEDEIAAAREAEAAAATAVKAARRAAAPALAKAIGAHLAELALPRARFAVDVEGDPPGDDVAFGLGANPGEPVLPLAKVASGGELARTMLAVRLVLTAGPPTLIFDEVDAGIGGEAAIAVGRALSRIGHERDRQVLVVTHLAQVAAFADAQIAVVKTEDAGRTVARAATVTGDDRLRELSRMLSGRPDSESARAHAAELLAQAATPRRAPKR